MSGIGDPIATHVRVADPLGITSTLSGGLENCGFVRSTAHNDSRNEISNYGNTESLTEKIKSSDWGVRLCSSETWCSLTDGEQMIRRLRTRTTKDEHNRNEELLDMMHDVNN